MKCTHCNVGLDDFKINIKLFIEVQRFSENEKWENIPNTKQESQEFLCKECFDKFTIALSESIKR
jgi:hypothetical protein